MIQFIKKRRIWFSISIILTIIGLISLGVKGLNQGIDFSGGTILEISIGDNLDEAKLNKIVKKYDENAVTNVANNRTQLDVKSNNDNFTDENINKMMEEIQEDFKDAKLKSSNIIGSVVGSELKQKAIIGVIVATIAILIYVGIRFELSFGIIAIITLIHDVFITITFYSLFNIPIDIPFIAGILTIVAYSVNDTIVIFDRIRENIKSKGKKRDIDYEEIANISTNQSIKRSLYTVITTLITITAITIAVPEIRNFGIPMIVGITSGCYSSLFIASSLWVVIKNKSEKSKA